MKRMLLALGICSVIACSVSADEYYPPAPAGMINPTEEINSSFSQSKDTNWFLHRIKPTNTKKITKPKPSENTSESASPKEKKSFKDRFDFDKKLIEEINKNNSGVNSGIDDGIKIVKPSEKTKTETPKKEAAQPKQEPKQVKIKEQKIKESKPEKVEKPKLEKVTEPKSEKVEKTKLEKVTEPKPEKVKEPKPEKVKGSFFKREKQDPKETVHTTPPAEQVIEQEEKQEAKDEKKRLQEEKERQQYRELQALSDQYQQAVALYNDNNLDASLEAFAKLPEDKRPPQAWLLMGNILMDKDKKDEAVFMYGRAILTDSTFYKAYYNLGNVYLSEDKYNMAIEQYKLAQKYSPNNPYVAYNLGCAYLKQGELRKAKSAFIRAVELNSNVADFHYNLAYVYKRLGKEKLAKTYLDNYNKLTGQVD